MRLRPTSKPSHRRRMSRAVAPAMALAAALAFGGPAQASPDAGGRGGGSGEGGGPALTVPDGAFDEVPFIGPPPPEAARPVAPPEEPPGPLELPEADLVAPILDAPSVEAPQVVPAPERPGLVIKVLLGLVALLALAYLGGHTRVVRWERKLGLEQAIIAGFPFVFLGAVARHPSVGILSDSVLAELSPLLRLALGWIGFVVGFRFDARMLDGLPRGTATLVSLLTSLPFLAVLASAAALLVLTSGASQSTFRDPVFLRDAFILATAGAMTARRATRLVAARNGNPAAVQLVSRIVRLEDIAGIVGLALVAAYFRPQGRDVTWQLPGTAWLFLTIGLGATLGVLVYAILRRRATANESILLLIGSVSFAAGIAGNLHLSPVVVCFVAGLIAVNFPGDYKQRVGETLSRLERPIYLVFLLVVGALWRVTDWRGWVLMVVFVLARFGGKWAGIRLGLSRSKAELGPRERQVLVISPLGPLAIAIVVNAQMLYPAGAMSLVVTAVVGGAIVTEVVLQLLVRRGPSPPGSEETPAPPSSSGVSAECTPIHTAPGLGA